MALRWFQYSKSWHYFAPYSRWQVTKEATVASLDRPNSRSCRFGIAPVDVWSAAQRAFGRWHLILGPQVNRHRRPQCPCKPLKTRLRYMMIVDSVKGLDVKCDSGIHGESLKPFIDNWVSKVPILSRPNATR